MDNPRKSPEIKLKGIKTSLEKYGVESPNQSDQVKKKQRKTKKEKYGDPNYCNTNAIRKTKESRYGDPNYNNREKSKRTCLERYGVETSLQSDDIKKKARQTKYLRYGDPDYTNREKSIKTTYEHFGVSYGIYIPGARNAKSKDSRPNIKFKKLLDRLGVDYEREYRLGDFIYDFKIGDLLIDINPSITHNSSINIFGGPVKDMWYHFNKTKNANIYGYQCVCIWDWLDPEKILGIDLSKVKQTSQPMEHWYNLKTHKHIIGHMDDPDPGYVLIWDDGQML